MKWPFSMNKILENGRLTIQIHEPIKTKIMLKITKSILLPGLFFPSLDMLSAEELGGNNLS